jgi:hypothetical protein
MNILRIAMQEGKHIEIVYTSHVKGADVEIKHKTHFDDPYVTNVLPALIACYKKFNDFIPQLSVGGFDDVVAKRIIFKEDKNGNRGLMIGAQAEIEDNNRPWNFTTPVKYESKNEPGKANTLSIRIIEAIEEIEKLCEAHVNAEPAQRDIFDQEEVANSEDWESQPPSAETAEEGSKPETGEEKRSTASKPPKTGSAAKAAIKEMKKKAAASKKVTSPKGEKQSQVG